MSTTQIFEDLESHLGALLTGYTVKYFRWSDNEDSPPMVLMRFPGGGGASDPLLQQFDVMLMMVQEPVAATLGHADMSAILKRVREGGSHGTVRRFEPLDNIMGPQYLDDGRPLWTLNVRCYTEGY